MKTFLPTLFKTTNEVEKWLSDINSMWIDADRAFEQLDKTFPVGMRNVNFPPFDVVKTEDGYKVVLAVAGFSKDDLTVEIDNDNWLSVAGKKEVKADEAYLVKGIATRQFARKWKILDQDEILDVSLSDGLLTITIKRNEPKPEETVKRLEIKSA